MFISSTAEDLKPHRAAARDAAIRGRVPSEDDGVLRGERVAVLSPDYLAAEYTQPEWAAAVIRDPEGKEHTLVPVRVRECKPDGLLAAVIHIDLVGQDEMAARGTLLAGVRLERYRPSTPPRFPGARRYSAGLAGSR